MRIWIMMSDFLSLIIMIHKIYCSDKVWLFRIKNSPRPKRVVGYGYPLSLIFSSITSEIQNIDWHCCTKYLVPFFQAILYHWAIRHFQHRYPKDYTEFF